MTARELIERLAQVDSDMEVLFTDSKFPCILHEITTVELKDFNDLESPIRTVVALGTLS